MIAKVHCPGCRAALRVPAAASGKHARCPVCHTRFTVPAPRDLFEETVASWIEDDLSRLEMTDQDERAPTAAQPAAQRSAPAPKVRTPAPVAAKAAPRPQDPRESSWIEGPPIADPMDSDVAAVGTALSQTAAPAVAVPGAGVMPPMAPRVDERAVPLPVLTPTMPAPAAGAVAVESGAATVSGPGPALGPRIAAVAPAAESPAPASAPVVPAISAPAPPPPRPAAPPSAAQGFPTDLHVTARIPHLVVRDCSTSGVRLAFDSVWLEHTGFRTSMPMRGVFSGQAERTDLVARPLAFIDRSGAALRAPQDLESRYEQHLLPGWSPRDLLNVMGVMTGLPRPFNLPTPYYVSTHHTHMSLPCATHTRIDGGITCEVLIPDGRYALDWLVRVNGACGPEYELLEQELAYIEVDVWRQLPEAVRQRVAVWCTFKPRERFRLYLNEADFGQHDAGLAGVVVTDLRLIFCKYHHRGAINLAEPAALFIRTQDRFAHLTLQNDEGRTRIVKLHPADVGRLIESLGGAKGLKVAIE